MKKIILFTFLLTTLTSCYKYSMVMKNGSPATNLDGNLSATQKEVIYLFGFKKKIHYSDKCPSGGMYEVEVKSSFLQSLINVVSLGIVMPVTLVYKCSQANE